MESSKAVKENPSAHGELSAWWIVTMSALSFALLLLAAHLDAELPAPRDPDTAKPTDFVAQNAYDVLLNLTSIGPRVAGSYENEVLGVGAVAAALRWAARRASPHNSVQVHVHTASGAFPLTFFDGMTNVYRDVSSVVARVSGAGARGRRPALLLNCHYDTVPGSPGASDDGAGCAVLAETLRALAAAPYPLRHDVVFLFNGAEENIMQASHAFVTTHEWAKSIRAFINIEACGAGGREVLFQAGPHDPWIMEVYSASVPRPFASSLAQELFESGLIPADTDFRVFRDFGNLSGVDLAWSANGYVYHTYLDTAERVPLGALQRTGDNVLALVHETGEGFFIGFSTVRLGLLASGGVARAREAGPAPVFFDVLGACVACARPAAAAAAALAALLLTLLRLRDSKRYARRHYAINGWSWCAGVCRAALCQWAAGAGGAAAALALALALHAAGARLAFYSRPWLLAPLYALPAVCVSWAASARAGRRGGAARGWAGARAGADAVAASWALLLLLCAARALRSGFVPLLWTLPLALAERAATLSRATERGRLCWWFAGAALPTVQTWYLSLGSLTMFVPLAGRCGTAPLPPDASLAALTAALTLAALSPLLPLVPLVRHMRRITAAGMALCLLTVVLVCTTSLGTPYSADRPQRFMVFHTRRTEHSADGPRHEDLYWMPHLDPNTPHSLKDYVPEVGNAVASTAEECAAWPYCGAPYSLPVSALVARGHAFPARRPPPPSTAVSAAARRLDDTTHSLHLNITGPSHIVVIVAPTEGAHISWCSSLDAAPQPGALWGARQTYFLTLHDARTPRQWNLTFKLKHSLQSPPPHWAALSIAGHSMAAPPSRPLAELLSRFPPWTAPVGWNVHQHLLTV